MERIVLKLRGVITHILPNEEISICEPVFVDCWQSTYRLVTEEFIHPNGKIYTFPKKIEEIDLSKFGDHLFLPADKNKIEDGNKYFVVYQPSKDKRYSCSWKGVPMYNLPKDYLIRRDYIPSLLNVGIKFPSEFITVSSSSRVSQEEIENFIK